MSNIDKAELALKEAEAQFGPDDARIAPHLEKLAIALREKKVRLLDAANMLARAEVLRQNTVPSVEVTKALNLTQVNGPTKSINELKSEARRLCESGQPEHAIPILRNWMSRVQGHNEQMLIVLSALAACLAQTGEIETADAAYQRALELASEVDEPVAVEAVRLEYRKFKNELKPDPVWDLVTSSSTQFGAYEESTAQNACPASDQSDEVPCPFCAEMIKREAILCRFCRSQISSSPKRMFG